MFKSYSPLRLAEHSALAKINLTGTVIDFGGDKNSEYRKLFKGDFKIFDVNFNPVAKPDLVHDLEVTPLPLETGSFNGALMINVVEHIYHYRELLNEASRLLATSGNLVIAIPFMFPVHPSPRDFNRFTNDALFVMLTDLGFEHVQIEPLGSGVFTARVLFLHRLLPQPLRFVYGLIAFPVAQISDYFFSKLAKMLGKSYSAADYALGYVITARKK